jgi:hypothetical protein
VEKSAQSTEMDRFNVALRAVLSVSKGELSKIFAEEKAQNADKPKRGPKQKYALRLGNPGSPVAVKLLEEVEPPCARMSFK